MAGMRSSKMHRRQALQQAGLGLIGLALGGRALAAPPKGNWTSQAAQKGATITLLGTAGGPPAHAGRSQPANLLQVDGHSYLVDCGEGTGRQLAQAGILPSKLDAAFLTHLHWDHVLGLDYVMATGWMTGRRKAMPIYGPPGTTELVRNDLALIGQGERIFRAESAERPMIDKLYRAEEIDLSAPREIFADQTVKVTATLNSHFGAEQGHLPDGKPVKAYSYRFDTAYGAVTFTGDTGPSAAVEQLAKGSDVLVGEIVDLASMRATLEQVQGPENLDGLMRHMREQHLTARELGLLAQRAGVRTLVLSHFVMGRNYDSANFVPIIREVFSGEVMVGKDLDTVSLGRP